MKMRVMLTFNGRELDHYEFELVNESELAQGVQDAYAELCKRHPNVSVFEDGVKCIFGKASDIV